jgi:hypothetical protein
LIVQLVLRTDAFSHNVLYYAKLLTTMKIKIGCKISALSKLSLKISK